MYFFLSKNNYANLLPIEQQFNKLHYSIVLQCTVLLRPKNRVAMGIVLIKLSQL
jgi:hypothetical protein